MKVTKRLVDKIEKSTSVYLVGYWARWGVMEYKWTGRWVHDTDTNDVRPIVYYYDDHNGTFEEYQMIDIYNTTSGGKFMWTFYEKAAKKVAAMLEAEEEKKYVCTDDRA